MPPSNGAGKSPAIPLRLASMDAYRGFVMLLMAGEMVRLGAVAAKMPSDSLWHCFAHHQDHVEWQGCTLHDLIQPSFSFLVGMALPWSIASRQQSDQGFLRMLFHTLWRALALSALGIALRSTHASQTNFTFEDTLTQIGLGYTFLWLLAWRSVRIQILALVAILLGYWAWFAAAPLPGPDFDPASVGVSADWMKQHGLSGFAAHWNKNANPAHHFDVWFLNLFPRAKPFLYNGGGYLTLSCIPTLGTMICGLLVGGWLRREDVGIGKRLLRIGLFGLAGLGAGWILDQTGIAPVVKRIWTPSWVLFSAGWCCLLLTAFYLIADRLKQSWLTFPLQVVGMNSIFMYVTSHLWDGFFRDNLRTHLGKTFWVDHFGVVAPAVEGVAVLSIFWAMCWWLWKKRLFIRI